MKTDNVSKTKSNETKAWFRSTFTTHGQDTDQSNTTARKVHTGPSRGNPFQTERDKYLKHL